MNDEIVLSNYTHASLYIDIACENCEKQMALSNACHYQGREYCYSCFEGLGFGKKIEEEYQISFNKD